MQNKINRTPQKPNNDQFLSNSVKVKHTNSFENQKHLFSINISNQNLKNNIFHSYTGNYIPNQQIMNMSTFEENKYLNESNNKILGTSYKIDNHIRRLSKNEILENYQKKLKYRGSSLNLTSDPTDKFDKILINLGKFNFIVRNYQIIDGRPNTTLRKLRLDIMREISNIYNIDNNEIDNTRFRGLNEDTYLKEMKNIVMYIEKIVKIDPNKLILRIINVDGKIKNYLPFESKYIIVPKDGNLRDVLRILENILNVSMIYFQLAEYFPFEIYEDRLNESSFCSISNNYLSIMDSVITNTAITAKSKSIDTNFEEANFEKEFGFKSDITFKEVVSTKKKSNQDTKDSIYIEESRILGN